MIACARGRLTDGAEQPDRGDNRGDPEQQRQAGGNERAERRHEDQQRDRQREELGPLRVVLERLPDRAAGAGVAEFLDPHVRMRGLHTLDGGEHGHHAIARGLGVAEQIELQQGRAAVSGDQVPAVRERRADVLDELEPAQLPLEVVDRRTEAGAVHVLRSAALDEHLLACMVGEATGDDLVGATAFPRAEILVALVDHAGRRADEDGRDDERQPAEDRGLAVSSAPPPGAGRKVGLVPHRPHPPIPTRFADPTPRVTSGTTEATTDAPPVATTRSDPQLLARVPETPARDVKRHAAPPSERRA